MIVSQPFSIEQSIEPERKPKKPALKNPLLTLLRSQGFSSLKQKEKKDHGGRYSETMEARKVRVFPYYKKKTQKGKKVNKFLLSSFRGKELLVSPSKKRESLETLLTKETRAPDGRSTQKMHFLLLLGTHSDTSSSEENCFVAPEKKPTGVQELVVKSYFGRNEIFANPPPKKKKIIMFLLAVGTLFSCMR